MDEETGVTSRVTAVAVLLSTAGAVSTETITYRYDANGRVVRVERAEAPQGTETVEYTYDRADNRTRVRANSATATQQGATPPPAGYALSDVEALSYIASYPDLIGAFGSDAELGRQHYQNSGRSEGRTITFNPLNYGAANPDLNQVHGADEVSLATHYIRWVLVRDEGRPTKLYASEPPPPCVIQSGVQLRREKMQHHVRASLDVLVQLTREGCRRQVSSMMVKVPVGEAM